MTETCDLCREAGGEVLWSDGRCRVVLVADARYPGYCRVVWNSHVAEMTDLTPAERRHLLEVTLAVEAAVRAVQRPDKINLASLGNMTPHLHWHVIPRWRDDPAFPQAIWAAAERPAPARAFDRAALRSELCRSLAAAVGATP